MVVFHVDSFSDADIDKVLEGLNAVGVKPEGEVVRPPRVTTATEAYEPAILPEGEYLLLVSAVNTYAGGDGLYFSIKLRTTREEKTVDGNTVPVGFSILDSIKHLTGRPEDSDHRRRMFEFSFAATGKKHYSLHARDQYAGCKVRALIKVRPGAAGYKKRNEVVCYHPTS